MASSMTEKLVPNKGPANMNKNINTAMVARIGILARIHFFISNEGF